jgi:two-component system, sensor histidine kinase PdtaS
VSSLVDHFGRLSTGIKILSAITLALLPLGLVALFASLAATRTADVQRSADLRVALTESTRKLSAELAGDVSAMRRAANAIAAADAPDDVCARLSAIFAAHVGRVSQYAVFGAASAPLCATPGFAPPRPSTINPDSQPDAILNSDTLDVRVPAARGTAVVFVRYPAATLAGFSQPSTLAVPYATTLSNERSSLPLRTPKRALSLGYETVSSPVGLLGLSLSIAAADVPFGTTEALLTFLPLLMWASAALIGFLVVDRLLIRPLRSLRLAVAGHVPGTKFSLPPVRTPAREIRDLGETFATFGDEISLHEAKMAVALADQTKATREVHHRVKNNLQVIASLISLHARSAQSPDAVAAYAAIQRRVDALSIVHRNHYAELDSGDGIDIKGLLSELAANLRAVAAADATAAAISVDSPRFGVSQDNAVAIAFLVTELVELSITVDPAAPIAIMITDSEVSEKAHLMLASSALIATPAMKERLAGRYARVLEGLSRQLRTPMTHDEMSGAFDIDFAILRRPEPN